MYHFKYFKEHDKEVLKQFIEKHPLGFLTGSFNNGQQVVTQVPFMLETKGDTWRLKGHIMRKTDHHKALIENPESLVVFTGPSAYVSATWYTNPVSGSTWNYSSVHLSGKIRFMSDQELASFMSELTLKYEGGNSASPTTFDQLPDSYKDKMMPAITGIELVVEKMDNVFKLSQNKDLESYNTIIDQLTLQGGEAAEVAKQMLARRQALFFK